MTRRWTLVLGALLVGMPLGAQQAQWPDTPQGKLAAGFFAAVNAPDEQALGRFQESFFSAGALRRRSPDERAALNRSLRDQAGTIALVEVRSGSSNQLVAVASSSNMPGVRLTFTFTFTGSPPKIDRVEVGNQAGAAR